MAHAPLADRRSASQERVRAGRRAGFALSIAVTAPRRNLVGDSRARTPPLSKEPDADLPPMQGDEGQRSVQISGSKQGDQ